MNNYFDPLFKGLTRPALLFGVPLVPFIINILGFILIAVYTQQFFLLIFGVISYFIMKAMTKKDEQMFRLFFLKTKFISNFLSRKYHKAKTFNSVSYKRLPINNDFPKLSIFPLHAEPSLEKLIPYSSLLTDSIVITKEHMLISTFFIEGIEFECESDENLIFKKNLLNMMIMSFSNEPIAFYFHNVRFKLHEFLDSHFENSFLKEIDEKYHKSFDKKSFQQNSLYLTLVYKPLKSNIDLKTFNKLNYKSKAKEISNFVLKFQEYLGKLEANIKDFKPKILSVYKKNNIKYSEQLEFYNYLIGGKFNPVVVCDTPIYQYLTGTLKNIQFNHDMIQLNYNDDTKRFARIIEIKDYSNETFSGILDSLMYLDVDYTITQTFVPLSKYDSKSALNKQINQLISSEDDGVSQIEQLNLALDNLISNVISFGNYHFSICVFGDSIDECKKNTNKVITSLNSLGFTSTLANIALPASYFSQFPSNFAIRPRVHMISSLNFSSLVALHNFLMGKKEKNCWGDAVTILKTPNKQPYFLNFHKSDGKNKDEFGDLNLANTLILGQSGGGKTVFMNFIINQMIKYANKDSFPANIPEDKKKFTAVFLDKDKGALGNILCAGGRYISIKNGKPTGFNPFMVETNEENLRFLKQLIKLCVTRNGEILNTKEEKQINEAVNTLMFQFEISERKYPISLLLENITDDFNDNNSLKSRLSLFQKGKQFGWVFDNEYDNLDFPDDINLFGIDGTEFLDEKDVSALISYFILWRVMNLADGRRLCIDIDEAWKWLENDIVAEEVKNKFKTIRKQNGFLRLATQSIEDFLKLKIANTLVEQSATKIFLPNPLAKEDEYLRLGLSKDEFLIVKNFAPHKRQFLVKRQDEAVVCSLDLSSLGKENLKILSTGTSYIEKIENIFNQENKTLEEKINELKTFYKEEQ
ncbi:VirB4 family type IV secretion/conjugal transfer ATPase [Campylobacter lari]|uniref:VirB4 family type IV secretion/conjugal transfer ATPase n=1 Tax=Campylobacter lari TaxID=201 RepID=UPI001279A920|nr:VirB4 family type IV secretion/conjugal transfer ATPase [Campylobacter lari]EII0701135.1 VirB4 family type IV secretion/conjugal transfer ATPase [Campylobacter lari]